MGPPDPSCFVVNKQYSRRYFLNKNELNCKHIKEIVSHWSNTLISRYFIKWVKSLTPMYV